MPASSEHVLAIDLGTGGPKVALVDLDGRVAGHELERTDLFLSPGGGAEQDPGDWWAGITRAVRRLLARPEAVGAEIAGVSVTAQWSGTVPVDAAGEAIGNAVIWMDSRGAAHIDDVVGGRVTVLGYEPRRLARWVRLTGGIPSHSGKDPVAHIRFLQAERPDVYDGADRLLEPADYLNLRICGRTVSSYDCVVAHWLTDNRDLDRVRYDPQLVAWSGVDRAKLPPLVPSASVVGEVTRATAAEWGVPAGTPVVTATGDVHSAVVGSGALADHEGHLYLGTSSWLSCHVPAKRTDLLHNQAALPSALPGRYFLANEHEAAGACLVHARDALGLVADLDEMNAVAAGARAGSNGLVYLPWLNGERTPVDDHTIRGGWTNLSLSHDRADLLRSVFEGVAYNSRWLLEVVERFTKADLGPMTVIGGGALSDLWCQTHADVFARPVRRTVDPQHAGTRGAAMLAAVALGRRRADELPAMVGTDREFTPDPATGGVHDELYGALRRTYKATRRIHRTLNG